MNEEEYIKNRLDDQINWYDRKSQANQKNYKILRIIEIIAAASIPFLTGYITGDGSFVKAVVGGLGLAIAIITAIIGLYQFQENWILYRSTCESLRHEKALFLTRTDPYNLDTPLPLLVQRVESIISKETITWSQHIRQKQKA